MTIEIKYTT